MINEANTKLEQIKQNRKKNCRETPQIVEALQVVGQIREQFRRNVEPGFTNQIGQLMGVLDRSWHTKRALLKKKREKLNKYHLRN